MAVFLRKLLRIGGLPDELRTDVEAEGIIYLAEYVPVTRRFSGRIPGKRARQRGELRGFVGADQSTGTRHPVDGAQAGRSHHRSTLGRRAIRRGDGRFG
ncbi:hypothetical protein MMOR_00120 [Mycolicibacterium moriokaense]|uniref:Uncharacterized protein n=1 Tax=Mycolicibacterium moriokaense TaxID=39691 RepID=A0AAD1H649_9MYCO|nr:hypothetical protein MMOR_00120 [Mycolicibacterium moriokaense]